MAASKPNPLLVKKHWHLLVFSVQGQGLPEPVSLYANSKRRMLSLPELSSARASGRIPENAVLVGNNYLGYGSQCDFTGQHPDPTPSSVSDAWLQGMELALKVTEPQGAVNPYDNAEHDVHLAQEWQLGFANGLKMRSAIPVHRL